ncbi:uncharacterized protein LOC115877777 [Sitophilus oryzae]|uniref:Uncharacterized protein LOC115877777 n=1 Tax=Sitophilus oryzae TaxID=7048 RepID=A0A6J2XFM3_SITOR|nr:uncharacterized protein LOC115877777 [Sitophilus oryzae]
MENLKPAILVKDDIYMKELSSEEFKRILNSWLEEKGVLLDMKSYLKFQMINMLRSTVIGNNICKKPVYSLAQQAVHLIVAEYLLQNKCNFTLSVFNTEVQLTNILPEAKLFRSVSTDSEHSKVFDKENLENILELIGFPKQTEQFLNIVENYLSHNCSLLSCLVNFYSNNIVVPKENKHDLSFNSADDNDVDEFLTNIFQIIHTSKSQPSTQKYLKENIKHCYNLKLKSFESQCIQLVDKFKKELDHRASKIDKLYNQKRSLEKQFQKLQVEYQILEEINKLSVEKIPKENIMPTLCSFDNQYQKEIEVLKDENNSQKAVINKLTTQCTDLLKEINICHEKINFMNIKMLEEEDDQDNKYLSPENLSISSDSFTDDIILQAKEKLRQLEEESAQLDVKYDSFINKKVS